MKRGKRYKKTIEKLSRDKKYSIEESTQLIKDIALAKFNETVEVAVRLGVKPAHAEQMVRGSVVLPKGTGKKIRVLVIAKGEKINEAKDAGADFVGSDDLIKKISEGWLDFDRVVATPDMMGVVGKLGKILGPRGLMPNPKSGTVTFDLKKAIADIRAGKVDFRTDKSGIVHAPVGKADFTPENLSLNILALLEALVRLQPSSAKGRYMRSVAVTTTMGPSILIDELQVSNHFKIH